jgi:hypothetical protein
LQSAWSMQCVSTKRERDILTCKLSRSFYARQSSGACTQMYWTLPLPTEKARARGQTLTLADCIKVRHVSTAFAEKGFPNSEKTCIARSLETLTLQEFMEVEHLSWDCPRCKRAVKVGGGDRQAVWGVARLLQRLFLFCLQHGMCTLYAGMCHSI